MSRVYEPLLPNCFSVGRLTKAERIEALHPTGGLLTPKDLNRLPVLKVAGKKFIAPATIDLSDYNLRPKDQGNKPWCAAYAAAGFAENILWRKNDYPMEIDPSWIYEYAKKVDGMPDADGTTLTAVLQALLANKVFDSDICTIKVLRTLEQVKYAIHKFGCCLAGFNISKEWYGCNKKNPTIYGRKGTSQTLIGGHAVLCCGYDRNFLKGRNSWGDEYGWYGDFAISWNKAEAQFAYGAVFDNCLYDMKMN